MQAPTLLEKTDSQITVQWAFVGEGFSYELFADYDTGEYIQVVETDALFHIVNPLPDGRTFKFTVRARNSCDVGEQSDDLSVIYASVPDQVQNVQTRVDECTLVIEWEKPFDGGAPIRRYIVQI